MSISEFDLKYVAQRSNLDFLALKNANIDLTQTKKVAGELE
jgi:hypothetical protein